MLIIGFLSPTLSIIILIIGFLSGGFSVVREVQLMYLPPKAQERKVFWGFVRIACLISFVMLWLNERDKVDALSSNASVRSTKMDSAYSPIAFIPEKPIAWNISFYNTGKGFATNVRGLGKSYIGTGISLDVQRQIVDEWKSDWSKALDTLASDTQGATLPPVSDTKPENGSGYLITAFGPTFKEELKSPISDGTKIVYVVDAVRYTDEFGTWEVHECKYIQPPSVNGGPSSTVMYHFCDFYQEPRVAIK